MKSIKLTNKNFELGYDGSIEGRPTPIKFYNDLYDDVVELISNVASIDAINDALLISSLGSAPVPVTTRTNNPIVGTDPVNNNIDALDAAIGADNVPAVRTNNPTVANTTINAKVQALDTAIGTDAQVTPAVRTVGPIVVDTTVHQKIEALDSAIGINVNPYARSVGQIATNLAINQNINNLDTAIGADAHLSPVTRTTGQLATGATLYQMIELIDTVIGYDAQLSGTPNLISKNQTIYQNLDVIDTYKSLCTIKKIVGAKGIEGCDFNFATGANTGTQVINLTSIIPAKSRVMDAFMYVDNQFTGAVSLTGSLGITGALTGTVSAQSIYAKDAIAQPAVASSPLLAISSVERILYLSATPGANWDDVTFGKVSVYVSFISVKNI